MKPLFILAALLFAVPAFAADPAPPTDLEIMSARAEADEAQNAYLMKVVQRLQTELKAAQDAAKKPDEKPAK